MPCVAVRADGKTLEIAVEPNGFPRKEEGPVAPISRLHSVRLFYATDPDFHKPTTTKL